MMASLWERALTLEGQELYTVDGKKFTFVVATVKRIDVSPEDGTLSKPIRIYSRDFKLVEDNLHGLREVQPKDVTEAGAGRGPSYIAGIINKLVEQSGSS
jgi:hypothetical protein